MEVHKYARQRASRRPGSNGCVIMRGRRAQSPETIIVCARVHLGVWLCDPGQRPPAPRRPAAAVGVAATCTPPAAERRPRRPLLLGRRLSLGGSPAPPIRKPIMQSVQTRNTNRDMSTSCTHSPNRIVSLSAHASCLIVVPPLSSKRVVVSRTRGVAHMAASVTCTNMHITSSCAKPHASLPRHMSHVQLSIAHFHAPLASALISPAPPYL